MAIFNMKYFDLSDIDFFSDIRLDKINVYSVTLVTICVDIDTLVSDFILAMRKYSSIQMIQQCSADFVRFTFVSNLNSMFFSKHLCKVVDKLELVYSCKINIL